jgi:peptidoglycan lytic transglycosylase G
MPQLLRPSKRVRHPLVMIGNAIITLLVLVAIVGGVAGAVGKHRFEAPGPLQQDKVVNIPRGQGIKEIADILQREGVIDQPYVFIGGVFAMKARDELKYGEYQFRRQASLRDVVDTLIEGKVVQHVVTIPEGLTSEQIVARLMENSILTGPVKEIPKEGSLLPETYRFTRDTTREQLIQRMQQSQRRALQDVWDRRSPDLPIQTPEQLVTLASIIEKETGRADERNRVAAVFVNRLKQKMRLQSDPTIIYGLVGGKGTLGRPIMRSEIEQPTPYNTYVIGGLPPGPIANPGRAALEAAANPSRTRELYFVADGSGGHSFSESLDQHQRAVSRLRQIEQQKPGVDQSPPGAASAVAPAAAAPATPSGQAAPAQTPAPPPRSARSRQPTAQSQPPQAPPVQRP